jgi:predicted nucleic acid-binding protein
LIVLDASALIELLLRTRVGREVSRRVASPELTLHAPHLLDLEVAQVLRRYVRIRVLGAARAQLALGHLRDLDLARYPHEPFLARIWSLRENLTAYDAAYVALAEALDAPLLTCDARMASAVGHGVQVEALPA